LSSSKARVVDLESELDAAASALAASQSEVTNLNADIATLKVTLASYQKEVLSLKDELASAKNNLDSTAAALAQELEISKSKSDSLKDEQEEERKLRKQVLSLEKELSESVPRTQLIQSLSEVASLKEEVDRQQRDLNGRDLIVMELRAEVSPKPRSKDLNPRN
jgi:chromosome segregation ATPase